MLKNCCVVYDVTCADIGKCYRCCAIQLTPNGVEIIRQRKRSTHEWYPLFLEDLDNLIESKAFLLPFFAIAFKNGDRFEVDIPN